MPDFVVDFAIAAVSSMSYAAFDYGAYADDSRRYAMLLARCYAT